MASTDEQMAERRRKNFAIRAEPARDPDFDGEKSIHWTYNGNQEYNIQLAPHEARKLYDLLGAEFGLGGTAEAPAAPPNAKAVCEAIWQNFLSVRKRPTLYELTKLWSALKDACAVQQAPDAGRDAAFESAVPAVINCAAIDTGRRRQEE